MAWGFGIVEWFIIDTAHNASQPWRLLTSALVHADAAHLGGNLLTLALPLALTGDLHWFALKSDVAARRRTWIVFVLLAFLSSLLDLAFHYLNFPSVRYRALGCSDAVIAFYGYASIALIERLKHLCYSFQPRQLKSLLGFTGAATKACIVFVCGLALVFSDITHYEKVRIASAQQNGWWPWSRTHIPEDNVGHVAHVLGFIVGIFVGALLKVEYTIPLISNSVSDTGELRADLIRREIQEQLQEKKQK
jgi:membrane associated rhomboid family serine protease